MKPVVVAVQLLLVPQPVLNVYPVCVKPLALGKVHVSPSEHCMLAAFVVVYVPRLVVSEPEPLFLFNVTVALQLD